MVSSQLDARPLKKATGDGPGDTNLELENLAVLPCRKTEPKRRRLYPAVLARFQSDVGRNGG